MLIEWIMIGAIAVVYLLALHLTTRRVVLGPVGWPRTLLVGIILMAASILLATYTAKEAGAIDSTGKATVSGWVVFMFIALTFAWVFSVGVAILIAT